MAERLNEKISQALKLTLYTFRIGQKVNIRHVLRRVTKAEETKKNLSSFKGPVHEFVPEFTD